MAFFDSVKKKKDFDKKDPKWEFQFLIFISTWSKIKPLMYNNYVCLSLQN